MNSDSPSPGLLHGLLPNGFMYFLKNDDIANFQLDIVGMP